MSIRELLNKKGKKYHIDVEITETNIILDKVYRIEKLEDKEFYLIDNYNDPIMSSSTIEDCFNYYVNTYV